ncbi:MULTISPECIES: alpha/beta fold hydrolase [unclassified Microbacterium]|uniref:alpha/beta hydrolase family protein n=1 Tax=unclassified Microbacterium TaxID=2609290 RepID=UPI00214CF008|nr:MULTISPECIES: alpha/beta fold hydrolase [unclassified Microbacterium]MCR2811135.1 alpha/beta fold hydrolase [Microbacterium sp. zg.B185]WIM20751.1 alpha/beta fold hydrolase [Microbacterium sp. zg-B185]
MRGPIALAGAVAVVTSSALGLGLVIGRRLTAPPSSRRFDLPIRGVEQDGDRQAIVLDRTDQTESSGVFTLLFLGGGWLQLSDEVLDRGPGRVARVVTGTAPGFSPSIHGRASWSGICFMTPADAGLTAHDVGIPTPSGVAPAWRVDGNGEHPATWAIHIHGLGSPRAGTLRGVQVTSEQGYTSLVATYRNDGEGPRNGSGRSTLGAAEVDDVDAAIQYAIDQGARQLVLFGWSMGAQVALQLAARPRYGRLIAGLVLESPVLDWVATIKANCARAGLPAAAGLLALPWLTSPLLARAIGLPGSIPLRDLDWIQRAYELVVPTLILHGENDDSAPPAVSRQLAALRADLVQLELFDADHTMTWNSDHERWRSTVAAWLSHRS